MKTLADLQVLMGRMGEAYFFKGEIPSNVAANESLIEKADFAMPISTSGVNFELGAPEITREKITEGRVWYTFGEKGDDNISMQVPSLHVDLSDLFYTKKGEAKTVKMGDKTYSAQGYNTNVKKVTGGWVFRDREHTVAIGLPVTDNYANLVGAVGDAMSYYNVAVSTRPNADDVDLIIYNEVADEAPKQEGGD